MMKFSHLAMNCLDIDKTIAFYGKHFGFFVSRRLPIGEGKEIVFIKRDDVHLELFPVTGAADAVANDGPATPGIIRHLAFQVDNVDAVLASMGSDAVPTLGPLDFDAFIKGWRTVWIKDPNGHIVEISQGYQDTI